MDKYTIGTFADRLNLDLALEELKDSDFPQSQITVLANEIQEFSPSPIGDRQTATVTNLGGKGARSGAVSGSLVGSAIGLLVGFGAVAIPFIGPIMLSEVAFTVIATAIAGGGVGVASGGILGWIVGVGIKSESPAKEQKLTFPVENSISEINYLVVIKGDDRNIKDVNSILGFQQKQWSNFQLLNPEDVTNEESDLGEYLSLLN